MHALLVALMMTAAPVAGLSLEAFPPALTTRAELDAESRRQLLVEAYVVARATGATVGQRRWLEEERARIGRAYSEAVGEPVTFERVEADAATHDVTLEPFWTVWVDEQLRLARLFPRPTSEVFPLDETDVTGHELPEWTFVLTFDDGPTAAGGSTDVTVKMLRELHLPAVFFVNGDRLDARKQPGELYRGFCLASHGLHHVPHVGLDARSSVESVSLQLSATKQHVDPLLFRPPYGQRSDDFATWLRARRVRTVLWNIDSQDWRTDLTAERSAGRVLALMLARRRGVILFHDVHPTAAQAVPMMVQRLERAPLQWSDAAAFDRLRPTSP